MIFDVIIHNVNAISKAADLVFVGMKPLGLMKAMESKVLKWLDKSKESLESTGEGSLLS